MNKIIFFGLMIAIMPNYVFGTSARYEQLVAEKQQKMAELEKCTGNVNAWKIAGISTIGLTAVGVVGNIALANTNKGYDDKISDINTQISNKKSEIAELESKRSGIHGDASADSTEMDVVRDSCAYHGKKHNSGHKIDFDCARDKDFCAKQMTGRNAGIKKGECECTEDGFWECGATECKSGYIFDPLEAWLSRNGQQLGWCKQINDEYVQTRCLYRDTEYKVGQRFDIDCAYDKDFCKRHVNGLTGLKKGECECVSAGHGNKQLFCKATECQPGYVLGPIDSGLHVSRNGEVLGVCDKKTAATTKKTASCSYRGKEYSKGQTIDFDCSRDKTFCNQEKFSTKNMLAGRCKCNEGYGIQTPQEYYKVWICDATKCANGYYLQIDTGLSPTAKGEYLGQCKKS